MINYLLLYFQKKWRPFALFFIFGICFAIIFFLNRLPLDSVLYGSLLCFYIGLVVVIIDFIKFIRHYQKLANLQHTVKVDLLALPDPIDITERQYQELLIILNQQKRELTEQANITQKETVDYFTHWTHQIKTPISAMRLLLQSEPQALTPELESELLKIEQYVEFVLQYLRLDHMSNDLVLMKQDLGEIVKQAIRKQAKSFIRKKITLHYTDLDATVLTDSKWLAFVIEQILTNALKYTNQGSISIYMEGQKLIIQDTGIGIRPEDLPRIFEKGFTGYNGRAFQQSTGIGLYLCKQILNKLSHQITIESEVGRGTKVILDMEMKEIGVE